MDRGHQESKTMMYNLTTCIHTIRVNRCAQNYNTNGKQMGFKSKLNTNVEDINQDDKNKLQNVRARCFNDLTSQEITKKGYIQTPKSNLMSRIEPYMNLQMKYNSRE